VSSTIQPGRDFPGVGVGLIIRRHDGRILMYRRLTAPESGSWSIVGGKIDKMEEAAGAARREAEEETGLAIGRVRFAGVVEGILPEEDQHWISLIYATEDFAGEARLVEPDKHSDIRWADIEDLPQPLSIFARKALDLFESN
jgi:8-oxo-dGTP diphosphatase